MDVIRVTLTINTLCILLLSLYSIYLTKKITKLEETHTDIKIDLSMRERLSEHQRKLIVKELNHSNKVGTWKR